MSKNNIHFVWFGGDIPDIIRQRLGYWKRFIDEINRREQIEPPLSIILWSDRLLTGKNLPKGLEFRDLHDEGLYDDHIMTYELHSLTPNYAAASDLARLKILQAHGGIYSDVDVLPPVMVKPGQALTEDEEKRLKRFIECYKTIPENSFNLVYLPGGLGNDFIFVPSRGNTHCTAILEAIEVRYRLRASADETARLRTLWTYFRKRDTFYQTMVLRISGPDIYLNHLKNIKPDALDDLDESQSNGPNNFFVECIEGFGFLRDGIMRKPLFDSGSDASWLGRPVLSSDDPKQAIQLTLSSIEFEVTQAGILRLEDHLTNLIESLGASAPDEIRWCSDALLEAVDQLDLNQVVLCQLTFKYPKIKTFYQKHGLMEKTGFSPQGVNPPSMIFRAACQPFENMHVLNRAILIDLPYEYQVFQAQQAFFHGLMTYYIEELQALNEQPLVELRQQQSRINHTLSLLKAFKKELSKQASDMRGMLEKQSSETPKFDALMRKNKNLQSQLQIAVDWLKAFKTSIESQPKGFLSWLLKARTPSLPRFPEQLLPQETSSMSHVLEALDGPVTTEADCQETPEEQNLKSAAPALPTTPSENNDAVDDTSSPSPGRPNSSY